MKAESKVNFDADSGWQAGNAESETPSDQRATSKGRLRRAAVLQSSTRCYPRNKQGKKNPTGPRNSFSRGRARATDLPG